MNRTPSSVGNASKLRKQTSYRGRQRFDFFEPLMNVCIRILHLIPRSLCKSLLVLMRHVPTQLGVAMRYVLIARLSKKCGKCVAIFDGVYLHGIENVEFGDHVSIHSLSYLEAAGGLVLGSNVSVAHGVTIMTAEHDFSVPGVCTRDAPERLLPVIIGDDVWIGCGVRLLAGVQIGDGAVVGAGAVVTKSLPGRTVAVGVPARIVRTNTKSSTALGELPGYSGKAA